MRGTYVRLSQFDGARVGAVLNEMREEAVAVVKSSAAAGDIAIEAKAFMRYRGQGWEIPILLPSITFDADGASLLGQLFEAEYIRLFGRALSGLDVEVMGWSIRAATEMPPALPVKRARATTAATPVGTRDIFDPRSSAFVTANIVERQSMTTGMSVSGPAVITERETTTVVTAAFSATMQADGCLLLQRKDNVHG